MTRRENSDYAKGKLLTLSLDSTAQIHHHQFAKWSKEREGFLVAQNHMDEELERLAEELECGSPVRVTN